MKQVTILGTHNTVATTVFGPMDVFFLAGQLWNVISGIPAKPYFNVEIVSEDGRPFRCLNNVMVTPHRSVQEVAETDLIIISSIADIDKTLAHNRTMIEWLRHQYRRGASIASVCTGAFLLAETGLLDSKSATTHWGFMDLFRERYPQIELKPEKLITDEGTLYCAGALSAGIDLSIYLVEKYCGHEVAIQCSKSLLHDMGRQSQAPYSVLHFQKKHPDDAVRAAQLWLENQYAQPVDMNALARAHAMSRRTFERRFKKATGDTPLFYLQKI
ncbi:MAG: DJ-1/PfpI family protein, partial [Smithellaceae bacterium]